MLQSRNVPTNDDHVGSLETICDVGRRTGRGTFWCGKNLNGFLSVADVIASSHTEFVLQSAFEAFDESVLNLRSVEKQFIHVGVAGRQTGRVLWSVAQPISLELAVRLGRPAPDHLDADGWFLFDDFQADSRTVGNATRRRRLFGCRSSPVAFSCESGHLDRIGCVRLKTADRVLFDGADVVAQRLTNNGILTNSIHQKVKKMKELKRDDGGGTLASTSWTWI